MKAEDQHAAAFVAAFRLQFPETANRLIHISNEAGQRPAGKEGLGRYLGMQKGRKARGVLPGVADYFLAEKIEQAPYETQWGGMWIELKAPGAPWKDSQIEFLEEMRFDYACCVAWGHDAALMACRIYLAGLWPTGKLRGVSAGRVLELSRFTKTGKVRREPAKKVRP